MASKSTAVAKAAAATPATAPKFRGLMATMSARFGIEPEKFKHTLKMTAFKQPKDGSEVSDEQMMALMVVAEQFKLNPFTKEIYAFPTKGGGIVPMIGFDGWIRMINEHPMMRDIEIIQAPAGTEKDDYYVTVNIWRKDRQRPVTITEYYRENYRDTPPWHDMPMRMTRNRALIQCGRVAFGFGGAFDPDDADKVVMTVNAEESRDKQIGKPVTTEPQETQDTGYLTLDQQTLLIDKCKEEGVKLADICQGFSVMSVDMIPADGFTAAMELIDTISKE